MDITSMRSLATLLAFVVFIGIIWWAFSRRNKSGFDEAGLEIPRRNSHVFRRIDVGWPRLCRL